MLYVSLEVLTSAYFKTDTSVQMRGCLRARKDSSHVINNGGCYSEKKGVKQGTHVYIVTKYSVNGIRANTNTCLCVNGRVSESACEWQTWKNYKVWSVIGSEFGEQGGTRQPKIPRSNSPPPPPPGGT